jgi:hypothetical protein
MGCVWILKEKLPGRDKWRMIQVVHFGVLESTYLYFTQKAISLLPLPVTLVL